MLAVMPGSPSAAMWVDDTSDLGLEDTQRRLTSWHPRIPLHCSRPQSLWSPLCLELRFWQKCLWARHRQCFTPTCTLASLMCLFHSMSIPIVYSLHHVFISKIKLDSYPKAEEPGTVTSTQVNERLWHHSPVLNPFLDIVVHADFACPKPWAKWNSTERHVWFTQHLASLTQRAGIPVSPPSHPNRGHCQPQL